MKLTDLSPSRLIAISLASYPIALSGFVLMLSQPFAHLAHRFGYLPCILLCLFLIAVGVTTASKATTALGDGVRLERWGQDELSKPRRIFEGPIWRAVDLVFIALAVGILMAFLVTRHNDLNFICLPVASFSYWTSGIRRSLKEPRESKFTESRLPTTRLQSQHWGR